MIVVSVLVVLAVIGAFVFVAVQGRRRRAEQQRIEAAVRRNDAEVRSASAQRREAEAREQAARARQDREAAAAQQATAERIDPNRRVREPGESTAGPATRTDDLHSGSDRHNGGPDRRAEQGGPGGRTAPTAGTDHQRRDEDTPSESVPAWQDDGGWHGPSASGGFRAVDPARRDTSPPSEPVVPSQRTGEHDRDQHEPAEGEHSGPVRALADRLLRRRG